MTERKELIMNAADELDRIRRRLEGMGALLDAFLEVLKTSAPTEETIEGLRAFIGESFDSESDAMKTLIEDLQDAAEAPMN